MSDSVYDYWLDCEALSQQIQGGSILVTQWRGTEGVSRLYRFEVTIALRSGGRVKLGDLLDKPATFHVRHPDGSKGMWHGIITECAQAGHDEGYDYFQLVLEPRLARLGLESWSDIYLDKTLDELIEALLPLAQITEPYSSEDATYDYRIAVPEADLARMRRPFVCQFEESCLNFLMRKLEFYGVYFWFDQGADREAVVFGNEYGQQPADPRQAVYYPKGVLDPDVKSVALTRMDRRASMQPDRVSLRALNDFDNTRLKLQANATVDGVPAGRGLVQTLADHFAVLESGDASPDKGVAGETLAKWRAEEVACHALQVAGEARTPGVRAGTYLAVSEYGITAATKPEQYYVVQVEHEGVQTLETAPTRDEPSYRARFMALPRWRDAENETDPVQFRPPRSTPVPRVSRLVTGFVDIENPHGPKRYAQPDAHGRYKVRLPFVHHPRDPYKNSAWLRQSTPYAAGASNSGLKNAGMHFPLREGTEVLIAFLNEDPDLPVIVGSLPNSEAPSVVGAQNARAHVLRTPGGSGLTILDGGAGGSSGGDESGEGGEGGESGGEATGSKEIEDASHIHLYTPTTNASLTLGTISEEESEDGGEGSRQTNGFRLASDLNGEIYAGQHLVIEVPGHYRVDAGGVDKEVLSNFIGSEATLAPGVKAEQTGGVVFENFMGAKFSSNESTTTEFTLGAAAEMFVGAKFESLFAAVMNVEWAFKKDVNLREKSYTLADGEWVAMTLGQKVLKAEGVAGEMKQQVLEYELKAFESYTVTGPQIKLNTPTDFAVLSLAFSDAKLSSLRNTTVDGVNTTISGVASTKVQAAGGVTEVTLDASGFSGRYPSMRSQASGMASMQAPLLQIG